METITAQQMRDIEREAIESGRVTGLELMERAGRGVVVAVFEEWPELAKGAHRAVVLCGPGNNGGDGFVVARLLKEAGWEVEAFLYGNADKLPPDAKTNRDLWEKIGNTKSAAETANRYPDLIVDAFFGIGLRRPIADEVVHEWLYYIDDAFDWMSRDSLRARTVAIDVPSGLDADTGRVLGGDGEHQFNPVICARTMLTVTFHRPKLGHDRLGGPHYCGRLVVKDIGL